MKRSLFLLALLFSFCTSVDAALIWGIDASGEMVGSRFSDDDIVASGAWDDTFSIYWDIEVVEGGWVYSYAIYDGHKDISHLNLEVTHDYPVPLVGHNGELLDPELLPAYHPGSPDQPADIFGVKFDHGADFISFFSDRAPVYGNFYAEGGFDPHAETNLFAYNNGLTDPLSMDKYDFIVRPDGNAVVPEPATMAMLGLGLGAAGLARRRKSKRENAC